jgi:hypothetical protein
MYIPYTRAMILWRAMVFAIHEAENCHYPFTPIVWRDGIATPYHE